MAKTEASSSELSSQAVRAMEALKDKAEARLKAASAGFAKLELVPFEVKKSGRSYLPGRKVSINPESYTRNFSLGHDESKKKSNNKKGKVNGQVHIQKAVEFSETLSFDLWLDSTGVIPGCKDVVDDLKWLQDNLVKFDGVIHSTRYVQVIWGPLILDTQLKSMGVSYLYFNRSGVPLRAKVSLSFEGILESTIQERMRNAQSPDLTHMRIVQAGENLPLMCYKIYNNPHYYLKVAEANGLANFTNIQPGQKIYFPPLKTD